MSFQNFICLTHRILRQKQVLSSICKSSQQEIHLREFTRFKNMFLICGGALCAIIGLVGILNFFNAIMTGILSRKREFAVLQSVGMTKRQLKLMLIYEGLFYYDECYVLVCNIPFYHYACNPDYTSISPAGLADSCCALPCRQEAKHCRKSKGIVIGVLIKFCN